MASQFGPLFQLEPEPFESQQTREGKTAPSADELQEFYKGQQLAERNQIIERKLSKRKSGSLWRRRSSRKTSGQTQPEPPAPGTLTPQNEMEAISQESRDEFATIPVSRSIIPEALRELPAWYTSDAIPIPAQRLRYPLHNPAGPKWYKNHHLIPRSTGRPPTIFSPSFPPMTSSHSHSEHVVEDTSRRNQSSSRAASSTHLPTPNSSQTRVAETGPGKRSRKNSETAHDTVDLLDGTDPWGTNWHHKSPYDIGLANGPVSVDVPDASSRSRVSSMTYGRKKGATPSPLSQSTSAVHLQVTEPRVHRKLSKRKTVTLSSLFGASKDTERTVLTLPATPLNDAGRSTDHLPRPMSTLPPSSINSTSAPTNRKDKRTSVLGRLARKFSILRQPSQENTSRNSNDIVRKYESRRNSTISMTRQPSPDKPPDNERTRTAESVLTLDAPDTVPTPVTTPPNIVDSPVESQSAHRQSMSLVDEPFSMGPLTIANPDAASLRSSTPPLPDSPPATVQAERLVSSHEEKPMPNIPDQTPLAIPAAPLPVMNNTSRTSFASTNHPEPVISQSPEPAVSPRAPSVQLTDNSHRNSVESKQTVQQTASPRTQSPEKRSRRVPPPSDMDILRGADAASRQRHSNLLNSQEKSTADAPRAQSPADAAASRQSRERHSTLSNLQELPVKEDSQTRPLTMSPVPFPTTRSSSNTNAQSQVYTHTSAVPYPSLEDSPYSTSSVLANPPTPYTHEMANLELPPPVPEKSLARQPVKTASIPSRQTETFKLVRSSSGNVYASTQTFQAAGEQWEVVESNDKFKDSKDSSSRKREKSSGETEAERSHRKGNSSQGRHGGKEPSSSHHRSSSTNEATTSSHRESKSRRRRDEEKSRDHKSEDAHLTATTSRSSVERPQPQPVTVQRRPSNATRPTSELPSSADLNALRAKEAWDMERLYKAKSMYSPAATSAPLPPAKTGGNSGHSNSHGSSHTSFMVQTPFQGRSQTQIYHSMPTSPPAIIYSPSDSALHSSPAFDSRPPLAHPLPPPPEIYPYQAGPQTAEFLARWTQSAAH